MKCEHGVDPRPPGTELYFPCILCMTEDEARAYAIHQQGLILAIRRASHCPDKYSLLLWIQKQWLTVTA